MHRGVVMTVSSKDEAYSLDELECIRLALLGSDDGCLRERAETVSRMEAPLRETCSPMAVFFMPVNMFSMIPFGSGDIGVQVGVDDVDAFSSAVSDSEISCGIREHLMKKLGVLREFLSSGGSVRPVAISMDCMKDVES